MGYEISIMLISFLVGIAIGMPLGWVFLGSTFMGLFLLGSSFSFTAATFFHSINTYIIMAIAFFVYAGSLISEAGLADRIVKFSNALVGRLRGGLIVVGIVATLILSALTGSSIPTISALIPLLVPRLETYGYKPVYTTAILCSSSFLGYLIPPSVPALMYGIVAQQSIAALFLSTVFPGLLLALGYAVLNHFMCVKYIDFSKQQPEFEMTWHEKIAKLKKVTWSALPALGTPAVILIGIYGGIFTPNEAGAVAVFYTLFIGFFIYRELTWSKLWQASKSTILTLGMYGILIGTGTIFTRLLLREGVGQVVADLMLGLFDSKAMILLSINIFLLLLGMFIDGIPILILAVPLILPIANQLGLNLIHLGAMVIVNVGLGVVTPPYAVSIFVGSQLSGVPYAELVKPMLVFLFLVGIPVLLLTTFIPALSCWLPALVLGSKVVGPW